jgi:hypothetical protein
MDYTDSVKNTIGDYEIYFSLHEEHDEKSGIITTGVEGNFGFVWRFLSSANTSISLTRMMGVLSNNAPVPCYINPITQAYGLFTILKLSESNFKVKFSNVTLDTIIINEFTL